ncbi:MFS transporter [Raineya orbicola]|jgi:MFS family permease|uniref:Major Facilitator Superfamily n=1 Tax=Raineya orbicola TaxID=2016530 RepID=A0A2N3IJ05_9BACT|nr:MFS transporter [Raineya orbicola]PKQ70213.1 Major Facilitator Superfamily [Raineya orbicola]
METSIAPKAQKLSFTKSIISIAALEAAITIGWLAYEKYQPQLLLKFSFVEFAGLLLVAQGILGAIFHPISGKWADKAFRERGSKFSVIISGAAFAAVIFVAVSVALNTNPASPLKWILPVLVILWLAAMATFHSPAISLIENFTPVHKFPQVAAILTMVFGLIYTIEPFLIQILNTLGLTITFILGGVLVISAAYAIKTVSITPPTEEDKKIMAKEELAMDSKKDLFLTGFFVGLFKMMMLFFVPAVWVKHKFFGATEKVFFSDPDYLQSAMLMFSALLAIPVSKIVEKQGSYKSLIWGCIIAFAIILPALFIKGQTFSIIMLLLMGLVYSLLSVASLPYILNRAKTGQTGYSIGLYYGGTALATAVILLILLNMGISVN